MKTNRTKTTVQNQDGTMSVKILVEFTLPASAFEHSASRIRPFVEDFYNKIEGVYFLADDVEGKLAQPKDVRVSAQVSTESDQYVI